MLQFGRYQLDESRRLLLREGTRVHLEPRVFDLLTYLIRNRDRAVPHHELLKQVWAGVVVERSALLVAARKLRSALETIGEAPLVETVHGFGFRFQGEVKASAPAAAGISQGGDCGLSHAGAATRPPALTVLAPRRISGASRAATLLTCKHLLMQLHQHRILPVVDADLVTDRTGRLLESARGSGVRYVLSAHVSPCSDGFEACAHLTDLNRLCVVWSRRVRVAEPDPVNAACTLSAQIAAGLWTAFMLGRVDILPAETQPDGWTQCSAGWRAYWTETSEGMRAALPYFESALRADGASPWARVGRSLASFTRYYFDPSQVQLLEAAKQDVSAVLEADPGSVLAQTYQAIYLRAEGRADLARSALETAQQQTPDLSWIACNRADLDLLEDPARAVGLYEEALRLDTAGDLEARILTGLATAQRLVGDFESSVVAAERAILAKPTVPYGYLQAAASWGALRSRERGRELLCRLRKHVPTLAPGLVQAHIRLKEGRSSGYGEQTLPLLRAAGWAELCGASAAGRST